MDPRPDPDTIRELAGLAPPIETVEVQRARAAGIFARADSLIQSSIFGESNHPEFPEYTISGRCSGTRCSYREPRSGYELTVRLRDFQFVPGTSDDVGTRHGITLVSGSGHYMGTDFTDFGAWMEHAGFGVQIQSATVEGYRASYRLGLAGGDLTGTRPIGSATWLGLMVSTPASGNSRGDRLQGLAALNYDLSFGALDVAFSSIKNIDRGLPHETETVLFANIPMTDGGTFQAGLAGNRIQGGFFGPGHAEAAGVFEQLNIVGAFGARKAPPEVTSR